MWILRIFLLEKKIENFEHFADGYSNVYRARTVPVAAGLRAGGTTIYAVGVGHGGGLDRTSTSTSTLYRSGTVNSKSFVGKVLL